MMTNKQLCVVAHFKDGHVVKGYTQDFAPLIQTFTIESKYHADDITEISMTDLKALFFVKSLDGNKKYRPKNIFDDVYMLDREGLKIKVTFPDGEIIRGTIPDFSNIFKRFFIIPVDPKGNNEKVYVEANSTLNITLGTRAEK